MKKLSILLLLFLPGVAYSATTGSIFYEAGGVLHRNLTDEYIALDSNTTQPIRGTGSSTRHHVMRFEVPLDPFGIDGVPTGRDITGVTLYIDTAASSAAAIPVQLYELGVEIDTPTWDEYDSVLNTAWTDATASNDAHISDGTFIVSQSTTVTTDETLSYNILTHSAVPATMSASFEMTVLIRMTAITGWVNAETTGAGRYRVVLTYSGAQPATPTPTNTFTNTPTNTPTPTNTNTPLPATNTPTPAPTALDEENLKVHVAGLGRGASTTSVVKVDSVNNRIKVSGIEFGDSSIASTAGAITSVTNYIGLNDTPNSFVGDTLEVLRVNAGETAIEHVGIATIAAQPTHVHDTDDMTEGVTNLFQNDEADQDMIAGFLSGGDNIAVTYTDGSNNLDIDFDGSLVETTGGTGQSTYTTGDMLYSDSADSLGKLSIGTAGYFLKVGAGIPAWSAIVAGDLSGLTDNHVLWGNASGEIGSEAALWYDDSTNRLGVGGGGSPDYTLDVEGNIGGDEYIYHNGDTDTYIRYQTDQASVIAGGLNIIDGINTTQDLITIGAASDIDVALDDDVFLQGSDGFVGFGTTAPGRRIHVETSANSLQGILIDNDSSGSVAYSSLGVGNNTDDSASLTRNSSANTTYGGVNSLNLITVSSHPIAFSTNNTLRMTVAGGGDVDIDNSLNVDGEAVVDQGLTVGNSSYQKTMVVGPAHFIDIDGSTFVTASSYWTNASTNQEHFVSSVLLPLAGSVIHSIRWHVYAEDSADSFDFAVLGHTHSTTAAPTLATILADLNNTPGGAGVTQKGATSHYYLLSSGGNFPYTVLDNQSIVLRVSMDPNATATSVRLYAAEIIYSERKY